MLVNCLTNIFTNNVLIYNIQLMVPTSEWKQTFPLPLIITGPHGSTEHAASWSYTCIGITIMQ